MRFRSPTLPSLTREKPQHLAWPATPRRRDRWRYLTHARYSPKLAAPMPAFRPGLGTLALGTRKGLCPAPQLLVHLCEGAGYFTIFDDEKVT